MKALPSFPSEVSSVYEDDACIHDNALFASGGLFRVCTDQPPRGDGRAGGNLPSATFREGCVDYGNLTIINIMERVLLLRLQ